MKNYIVMLVWLVPLTIQAQQITGTIKDGQGQAMAGATVRWLGTSTGTAADADGRFSIAAPALPARLVASYAGYLNDTIDVSGVSALSITLKQEAHLKEVVVTETREATTFSTIDPMNRQSLSTTELKKSACCNLSESFETNATVDVSYTDAVSGSKQIRVLGLDGAYTQILHDQMPGIRGLSTVSGLAHIPGTWVNSIDITKGVGSVTSGYESISGQINIDLLRPEKADPFHVNVYAGDAGRYEGNVHLGRKFGKKWSTLLLTHGSGMLNKNDFNSDGYVDAPLSAQFNVMNRWKYEDPGKLMAMFGVQALTDERRGGQVLFNGPEDNASRRAYGVNIATRHAEAFSRVAAGFAGRPYKSIALTATGRFYEQQSYYGLKSYSGNERTLTMNLMYQTIIGNSANKLRMGASYMLDAFRESYNDSGFRRTESVPGVYAEYNYDLPDHWSLLAGVRTDYHNLYGAMLNPRMHLKVHLRPLTVLRLSGGRGMRVANIFVESGSSLASSRQVVISERLNPEVAWNYGVSLTHKVRLGQQKVVMNADFFRTDFENQVVADLDFDPQQVVFSNLKGASFANTFQAEVSYEPVKRFEARLAYKWQDVMVTYHGSLMQKPFVPRDRILFNLAYATRFDKWKFDFTTKWFGESRIPQTAANPAGFRMDSRSPSYYVFNAQITRAFKRWEVYAGAENIFDYVQQAQVIDPENPFGKYFDASLIWGPVMGRVIYTGMRFTIK